MWLPTADVVSQGGFATLPRRHLLTVSIHLDSYLTGGPAIVFEQRLVIRPSDCCAVESPHLLQLGVQNDNSGRHRRGRIRRIMGSEDAPLTARSKSSSSIARTITCFSRYSIKSRPPGCPRLTLRPLFAASSYLPQRDRHARYRRGRRRHGTQGPNRTWTQCALRSSHPRYRGPPRIFRHDDWEPFAPGLKCVEDATEIRRRILLAFRTSGK